MHRPSFNRRFIGRAQQPFKEVECICIAADLLQQMLTELLTLATNNAGLARAMEDRLLYARDRLQRLRQTAGLLIGVDDEAIALALQRRASALITSLSDEFDELSLYAIDDHSLEPRQRLRS